MTTISCDQAQPLLAAYGDGELGLAQTLAVEAHLKDCAACSARQQQQRGLGEALRSGASYHRMPATLRAQLAARLPGAEAPVVARPQTSTTIPRRRQRLLQWTMPLAASLALAIGVNALLSQQRADSQLTDQVVAAHVRSLMLSHLDDVVSSDHHKVKPWFAGKLDYAPPVGDLAAQGFPLSGGRLDYLDGRAVAALDYRHGPHVINLFVWPVDRGGAVAARSLSRTGYNLRCWTDQGMTWWAVSDLNAQELSTFADQVRAATHPG